MKKNEQYTVECLSLTDLGAGVCKVDGQVVYVYDFLPGEQADIRIIKTYSKYAIGKVVALHKKSEARTDPVCPVAKRCGGCQMQSVRYEAQCGFKNKWMRDLFKDGDVRPILPAKEPLFYRNKAQFPVSVQNGQVEMGFYRPRSNTIVDTTQCWIQSRPINEIFAWIKTRLSIAQAEALRHVMIRVSSQTGEAQVVWIGRENIGLDDLTARMVERFPAIQSVVFNENRRADNVILGETYTVLHGRDWIEERCMGNRVKLHFKAFFQVDPAQMEALYQTAIDLADFQGDETCVELYAGTGTIGMAMAGHVKEVVGVEIVPEAVENANENVRWNGLENCRYVCQDATAFVGEYAGACDVLVVDPPRKGMSEEGICHIEKLDPEKIIYISCNPKTLRRDVERLAQSGYRCEIIQPVDMFPYTTGIECVARIVKERE